MRKIIQIAFKPYTDTNSEVEGIPYALLDNGEVYCYEKGEWGSSSSFEQLLDLLDPEVPDSYFTIEKSKEG